MLSISLSVTRGWRSSLNFYSASPDVFDDHACLTAGLFGLQAATLLYGANRAAGLNQALQTRDVIGQAKGILMERFDITDDAAFQMLVSSLPGHQHEAPRRRPLARQRARPAQHRRPQVRPPL